jgi:DNA replication protein DnaC
VLHIKKARVRYEKASDLLLYIRHTFSDRGTQDESTILNRVLSFDLLILEDVGWDPVSEWIVSTYTKMLDRRLEYLLPIIVTSNLSLEEKEKDVILSDRIGYRAVSRLREMCGDNIIEFKGPDLR